MTAVDPPVTLVLPGSLYRLSGGTLYDKAIVDGLTARGWSVRTVELADSFPTPSATDRRESLARLRGLTGPVAVDGLALGALGGAVAAAVPADRLIALVHHPLADEGGMPAARRAHLLASEGAALAAAGRIVTTSAFTARRVRHLFHLPTDRVTAIPPGVDRPRSLPAPRPPHSGPARLLGIGSLIRRKRWPLLIATLARLRDRPWTLDLVGPTAADPAEARRVRSAIRRHRLAGRVTLHGPVSAARLAALIDGCDLLVHPAAYEGYGMVLAEAAARGRPVLCTAGGATAEAAPAKARIVIPPDRPAALEAALATILARPRRLAALALAARAAARQARGWDDAVAEWATFLRRPSPGPGTATGYLTSGRSDGRRPPPRRLGAHREALKGMSP